MTATVIIATRNRAEALRLALQSLADMQVPPPLRCDVIVVDNASTDATREVVRRFQASGRLQLHYLFEERRGKSICLNAGLREAAGEILAFTDDDCVVAPDWLANAQREFSADPELAAIGGRVELYDARDRPYTIRTHASRTPFAPDNLVSHFVGCNMVFRRTALALVGEFDPSLGPGSPCHAAEDFDLLYRSYLAGLKIVYVPEVLVFHNHGRRTDEDVRRLYSGYGICLGAFYAKYLVRADRAVFALACRQARGVLHDLRRRLLGGREARRANRVRLRDLVTGAARQLASRLTPAPRAAGTSESRLLARTKSPS